MTSAPGMAFSHSNDISSNIVYPIVWYLNSVDTDNGSKRFFYRERERERESEREREREKL